MLAGFLIGDVPIRRGIGRDIAKRISSDRHAAFFRQNFQNMARGVVLIAFRAAEGNKRSDRRTGDDGNFFQPLDDIGRRIVIKYRRANEDEIVFWQNALFGFLEFELVNFNVFIF